MAKSSKKAARKARRLQRRRERGGSFFGRLIRSGAGMIPGVGGFVQSELQAKADKRLGINSGAMVDQILADSPGPPRTGASLVLDTLANVGLTQFAPSNQPDRSASTQPAPDELNTATNNRGVAVRAETDTVSDTDTGKKSGPTAIPKWALYGGIGLAVLAALYFLFGRSKKASGTNGGRRRSGTRKASTTTTSSTSSTSSTSKRRRSGGKAGNPFPGVNPNSLNKEQRRQYMAWVRSKK